MMDAEDYFYSISTEQLFEENDSSMIDAQDYTVLHQALAEIYISIEATTKPTDFRDSRPRQIPEEMLESYVSLVRSLEKHHNVEHDAFILGARPYIRNAIGLSGFNVGYVDEGLDLAQMVTRASPTGYGVHYESNIHYRH